MKIKREDISEMIESIGLPCSYYEFPDDTPQVPPFICWFFSMNTDVFADDLNYADKEVLNVELYTKFRDFEQETAVEEVLSSHGFTYAKEANYVDSEKIWQISYESEVILDGK